MPGLLFNAHCVMEALFRQVRVLLILSPARIAMRGVIKLVWEYTIRSGALYVARVHSKQDRELKVLLNVNIVIQVRIRLVRVFRRH